MGTNYEIIESLLDRRDMSPIERRDIAPTDGNIIVEMSATKREAFLKITNLGNTMCTTLMKLYCFRDAQEFKHWSDEVSSYINKIPKIKASKGKDNYPDDSVTYRWLFGDTEDIMFGIVNGVVDEINRDTKDRKKRGMATLPIVIGFNLDMVTRFFSDVFSSLIKIWEDSEEKDSKGNVKRNLTSIATQSKVSELLNKHRGEDVKLKVL